MTRNSTIGLGAAAVIALVALILLFNRPAEAPGVAATEPELAPEFQPMRADEVVSDEGDFPDEALADLEEDEEEPIHYNEDGMDPEDQPRIFMEQHYRPGELPAGYKMHNVRLTDRGFELEPAAPGNADQPRIGMVESPPIPLDFPANAVAPSWIDELPEGTSVLVEVAVSPDGENWGMWHPADVDHDSYGQVNEFYPDGTPNPNYGYTPGGLFVWGNMQWKYVKYTVALYSESQESPAFSSRRFYVQDSTMGGGRLAELNVPEESN